MYKFAKVEQKIKIVIPPYIKGMGQSITMNLDKESFYDNEMTLDYMVTNFLKDFSKHPKF
jgi:hypothetical protein